MESPFQKKYSSSGPIFFFSAFSKGIGVPCALQARCFRGPFPYKPATEEAKEAQAAKEPKPEEKPKEEKVEKKVHPIP